MIEGGWIKLYRKIREHWLWPRDRRYSKLEAWLDLILSANHKPAMVNIGSQLISVDRGGFLTSQVELAKRWKWNRETVFHFLSLLKTQQMIDIRTSKQTSTGYTLINIRNYGKYQDHEASASGIQSSDQPTGKPASDQHPTSTNKNDKNEKNRVRGKPSPNYFPPSIEKIIGRLNQLSGKSYRPGSKAITQYLLARLKEGATEEDCLTVLEDRWLRWKDKPDMIEHFNPITLFRPSNFERYLTEAKANGTERAPVVKDLGDGWLEVDGRRMERKTYERRYGTAKNSEVH